MKTSNGGTFPGLKFDRLYEDTQDEQVRITRDQFHSLISNTKLLSVKSIFIAVYQSFVLPQEISHAEMDSIRTKASHPW